MKHINKPISFVVAYKIYPSGNKFGRIIEFARDSKGMPKTFSTLNAALKKVKELRTGELHSEHWVAMTTWRLAEQHQIRLA
jgi:hypothetical protein